MPILATAHALSTLVESDAAWRLMRADHAPIIVALLREHLGAEERRLAAEELYLRVDDDLEQLRAHGFTLPQSAQGYCAEWRRLGFLVRRPAEEARGETFELSPAALTAIRFVDQLQAPRQTVTESRLASLAAQVSQLAVDSDPDTTNRLRQLHAQRDRIDAQIEAIASGADTAIDPQRAIERMRDILAQAEDIPTDFARVRADFEALNRDLRARIIESEAAQRTVLDEVFRGVDLIAESDAGRSFTGFSALVLDPAVGEAFDEDIHDVLDRDFADGLTASERRFLRRFLGTLKARSAEIHDVITAFARGLRRYVQSQDYQRDRVLRGALREAIAVGAAASEHVKPYRATGIDLELSAVQLTSVGAIRLHDPAELDATSPIRRNLPTVASIEELRRLARETEIDFAELTDNVNALLTERDACTIGDVLARFPATQGVASVVGLLSLAGNQAVAVDDETETVRWTGGDAIRRTADIPTYRFTGRVA
ncbi:DUF3375 domain-containing protein [Agromyces sp. GXS1127]|uniref:DUF3375 domain-containing protein n=1 Tax=Agromyces sp. GXS1127 TaxID=3424181 RepID=UPI003D31139D